MGTDNFLSLPEQENKKVAIKIRVAICLNIEQIFYQNI
jgi:hypothetical protein